MLNKFHQAGIFVSPDELNYFESIFNSVSLSRYLECASSYYQWLWQSHLNAPHNGYSDEVMFRGIIVRILILAKIQKIHFHAQLFPYSNIQHECVLYSKERGPIPLNFSVEINETYKSMAMKSVILKQAYPRSKSFLITMDEREAVLYAAKLK